MRKSGTLSEVLLWRYLKGKKVLGYDFDRQKPIDNFIVDFFCNELMLAIEIDGVSHENKGEEDGARQSRLESLGVRFLRFYDSDIKENIQGVLWVIEDWIRKHKDEPTPCPSQEGKKFAPDLFHEWNTENPLSGGDLGVGNTGGNAKAGNIHIDCVRTSAQGNIEEDARLGKSGKGKRSKKP